VRKKALLGQRGSSTEKLFATKENGIFEFQVNMDPIGGVHSAAIYIQQSVARQQLCPKLKVTRNALVKERLPEYKRITQDKNLK
jgi:hypothetical protein